MPAPILASDTRLSMDEVIAQVKEIYDYTVPRAILGLLIGHLGGAGLLEDLAEIADDANPEMFRYSAMVPGVLADVWWRTSNALLKDGSFHHGLIASLAAVVDELKLAKAAGWDGVAE